ncbi:winged helix-turn-helix transcriptional regulator [Marinitenerispora sediminis]|uniref:Transcriptional regulator n=1 Tax=Marinitenerispora sediminis TaxID=1931232 RepID=A0A368T4K9_9ACTN|nr:helix-turn-helix domain-containing protein [Marinitenerispora sediminis]RCV49314.1 transcriptional regulator [Marinitenerispora sediminis]RCV52336.1 transcriptional regulator [Marinitenerispora sediminis]RCV58243.1 transcriptional regulator [Marinitenerispora sediminis]
MPTRTAAQRRAEARTVFDAAFADCPSRRLMERIGEKWVALLLTRLADGPRRHGDLRRSVPGVSQKMLTQTLRGLERDGLVRRSVTAGVPARVDYALTPLGESLLPVLAAVSAWADRHMADIDAARAAHGEPARSGSAGAGG